jgi:c-di-GMP-related signal transduction protein
VRPTFQPCCGSRIARGVLVRRAQPRKLQILATSVERDEGFVRIRESSFDLIQGQCHSEPSNNEETQANSDGKVLLQLLVETRGELEIDSLTRSIEMNPVLQEGLLRLAVCHDRGEFVEVAGELSLDPATIWEYQCDAYDWVMQMI